jgi:hypothetical protein
MTDRIAELQTATSNSQEEPWEGTQSTANASTASGAGPLSPVAEDDSTAADPLLSLAYPPAGLQAWPLTEFDGKLLLPTMSLKPNRNSGSLDNTGHYFFRLLADTYVSQGLENEGDLGFLSSLLAESTRKQFLSGWGWAGSNEIEQQESHDAFVREVLPAIRQMTPKLPLVLHWTERAMIGTYDLSRGGFPVRSFAGSVYGTDPLELAGTVTAAGLVPTVAPSVPDLFWIVDKATADTILKKWPDRALRFVAVVELGQINPGSKGISIKLDRLSLYTPDLSRDLHDYSLKQPAAEADSSSIGVAAREEGAAQSGAAASADDAERWHIPMLDGLPWIDGQNDSLSSLSSSGDYGNVGQQDIRPQLSARELWTRAVIAMGLAQTSNLTDISDQDAIGLSCIFLPRAAQMHLFKHPTCGGGNLSSPTAQFDLEDGAAAFRSKDVPRIQAAAPRLPFQFLYVLRADIGRYDEARHGFVLNLYIPQGGPQLFGSNTDVELPNFWPASEEDARRFVAAQSDSISPGAWAVIKLSIIGTKAGAYPNGGFVNGLPKAGQWRFNVDGLALYADKGLQTKLYDFGGSIHRLPPTIMGTPAETKPPSVASVPLSPETALMALIHSGVFPDEKIDWGRAAVMRQAAESFFKNTTDWRDFDPWGVFFPDGGANVNADAYRRWTLLRSAAMPDTFTITRTIDTASPAGTPIKLFPTSGFGQYPAFGWTGNGGDPGTQVDDELAALGIDTANLLPTSLGVAGDERTTVRVAFPQPAGSYQISTAAGMAPGAVLNGSLRPSLVVTTKLEHIDVLPNGQYNQRTVVLRLIPTAVRIRSAGTTLFSAPIAISAFKTLPPQEPIAQRLAGAAYGPDMLGIRLGMKMDDAAALARAALHVTRESDTQVVPPRTAPAGSATSPNAMLHGHLFVNDETHEAIALFEAPHEDNGKVLAVWRNVQVPSGTWNALLPKMIAKYGQPVHTGNEEAEWARSYSRACVPVLAGASEPQFYWMKGSQHSTANIGGGIEPSTVLVINTFSPFADCGPVVRIGGRQNFLIQNDPNMNLEMEMFDLGVLSKLLSGPKKPVPSANAVSVKF